MNRTHAVLAALPAALVFSLAGAAIAAPPSAVGTVAAVLNQVRIKLAASAPPRPAAVRQRLFLGNQVQTGPRSNMQALLLDHSAFTVGPNSQVTIDRFVYNPAGSSFSSSIAKGAMRFMSGTRSRGAARSISTPVASIGIRGTVVDTVVGEQAVAIASRERAVGASVGGDPASASLIVLRGPAPGVQGNVDPGVVVVTAGGRTIELDRPRLAVYMPGPGAEPIGPFTISLPGLAQINDLMLPPTEAQAADGGPDPYLQRGNDRPRPRLRPVLPGELPQDAARPDTVTPGDVPIFEPRAGDYPDQGPPPPNNPPPSNNPPPTTAPGTGSPGTNQPGGGP